MGPTNTEITGVVNGNRSRYLKANPTLYTFMPSAETMLLSYRVQSLENPKLFLAMAALA